MTSKGVAVVSLRVFAWDIPVVSAVSFNAGGNVSQLKFEAGRAVQGFEVVAVHCWSWFVAPSCPCDHIFPGDLVNRASLTGPVRSSCPQKANTFLWPIGNFS